MIRIRFFYLLVIAAIAPCFTYAEDQIIEKIVTKEKPTKTTATLKLLTRNVEIIGEFGVIKKLYSLTGIAGKHWALIVQFRGDDQIYLCEMERGVISHSSDVGDITGNCKYMSKEEAIAGKQGIAVYSLGTIETTPKELSQKSSEITYNGQFYNVFSRNCQHWVKQLLAKYGKSTTWFTFLKITTNPNSKGVVFTKDEL